MRYVTTLSNLTGCRMELKKGKGAIYDKVADIEAGKMFDFPSKDRGQTYMEYQCCFYTTDGNIERRSGTIRLSLQEFFEFKVIEFNSDQSKTNFSHKGTESRFP